MVRQVFGVVFGVSILACGVSTAMATNMSCNSATPITNVVTTLGTGTGNACYVAPEDNILFSDFSVSPTTETIGIANGPGTTGVYGSDVVLVFQVSPASPDTDTLLSYMVTGGIQGIDLGFTATGGNVTITETACSAAFVMDACPNGDLLATIGGQLTNTSGQFSANFAPTSTVYIQKDIDLGSGTVTDFSDSVLTPEPMTFSMLGLGLLGIGLVGRRVRR
jgi:hypothetical protein